jgi:hypothetical protein
MNRKSEKAGSHKHGESDERMIVSPLERDVMMRNQSKRKLRWSIVEMLVVLDCSKGTYSPENRVAGGKHGVHTDEKHSSTVTHIVPQSSPYGVRS